MRAGPRTNVNEIEGIQYEKRIKKGKRNKALTQKLLLLFQSKLMKYFPKHFNCGIFRVELILVSSILQQR